MTYQETFAWLLRPRHIDRELAILAMKRDTRLNGLMIKGMSYDGDSVQTSPQDKTSEIMAEVDEIDRKILELYRQKHQSMKDTEQAIDQYCNTEERVVLTGFFVDSLRMEEIAEMIPCSRVTCYRIRKQAIRNLSKVL